MKKKLPWFIVLCVLLHDQVVLFCAHGEGICHGWTIWWHTLGWKSMWEE